MKPSRKKILWLGVAFFLSYSPTFSLAEDSTKDCPDCSKEVPSGSVADDPTYQAYAAEVRRTESGNNTGALNNFGFAGSYQMGKAALIDAGFLVNNGNVNSNDASTYVWTQKAKDAGVGGEDGSITAFLANQAAQDAAFLAYTNANLKTLKRIGATNYLCTQFSDGSREGAVDIWGLLKASHLVGAGGASTSLKTGTDKTDAYGTKASKYMMDGTSLKNNCIPNGGDYSACTPGAAINGESSNSGTDSDTSGTPSGGD